MKTRKLSVFVSLAVMLGGVQAALAQFNLPREIPQILDAIKRAEQPKPAAPTQAPPTPVAPTQAPAVAGENQPGAPTAQVQPAAAASCPSTGAMGVYLDRIEKTKKEAADYTPGARGWYVSELNDRKNEYLEAALSAKDRKIYFDAFKNNGSSRNRVGELRG